MNTRDIIIANIEHTGAAPRLTTFDRGRINDTLSAAASGRMGIPNVVGPKANLNTMTTNGAISGCA